MRTITTRRRVPAQNVRQGEKGFTLVELMVVVAIIAILAAIGVPRMITFIRTAQSSEASEQMGRIGPAIRAYIDIRPTATASDLTAGLNGKTLTLNRTVTPPVNTGTLTTLIPNLLLAESDKFDYTVRVRVNDDAARTFNMCVIATKLDNEGNDDGSVIYSYTLPTSSKQVEWENNFYRKSFVEQTPGTVFVEGGDCNADGTLSGAPT